MYPRLRLWSVTSRPTERIELRIANGQQVLARMRMHMCITMLVFGFLATLAYACLHIKDALSTHLSQGNPQCSTAWQAYCHILLKATLYNLRLVFFGMAPLYDDTCMMRLIMFLDVVLVLPENFLTYFNEMWKPMPHPVHGIAWLFSDGFATVGLLLAMCRKSAAPMRKQMWRTLHIWVWIQIWLNVLFATAWSVRCQNFSFRFLWMPPKLLMVIFISRPGMRQRYHEALLSFFEGRSQDRSAAAVAAMVGRCPAHELVRQAAARFRGIQLAALRFEDLSDNTPNPALFDLSVPVELHKCDAFVSHSWHDDAKAKWAALQRWRRAFVEVNGREPIVWIDKCCIDQNNIEADLRCLPIFLSGCRRLVVFCGTTYLSRLWCILELFTFVQIGRRVGNVHFEFVLREGQEDEDRLALKQTFEQFDARECTCFCPEDKDRMLSIIHAAFGTMRAFNKAVRAIFFRAGWQDFCTRPVSHTRSTSSFYRISTTTSGEINSEVDLEETGSGTDSSELTSDDAEDSN